ncbi:MAG: Activator of Hsp90 ATPase 1 family protein [Glaciihabitans sp.]|nr:Activator of Hsp90 ATPase 1 family protein [Glaciihabitans sp.]
MIEPLALSFEVRCGVRHAFETWTSRIDSWWPADHTVTGTADASVVLERQVGGRIFEREPDGTEHDWGEVIDWEPPSRFSYLWHIRRQRDDATTVDIRFTAVTDTVTRVDILHSGWERLGAGRGQDWRDRNFGGWSTLLPHYVAAATATS